MRRLETHVLVLVVVLVAAAVTSSASELLHRKRIRDLSDDDQDDLHTFYHNDVFKSSQLIRQKRVKRTPKKLKQGIALLSKSTLKFGSGLKALIIGFKLGLKLGIKAKLSALSGLKLSGKAKLGGASVLSGLKLGSKAKVSA